MWMYVHLTLWARCPRATAWSRLGGGCASPRSTGRPRGQELRLDYLGTDRRDLCRVRDRNLRRVLQVPRAHRHSDVATGDFFLEEKEQRPIRQKIANTIASTIA